MPVKRKMDQNDIGNGQETRIREIINYAKSVHSIFTISAACEDENLNKIIGILSQGTSEHKCLLEEQTFNKKNYARQGIVKQNISFRIKEQNNFIYEICE